MSFEMLEKAAKIAVPTSTNDQRSYWLGCVGIREDGVLVSSRNGAVQHFSTVENYQLFPESHAEGRVLRKLGKNGTIFVARVSKKDNSLAMARACSMCRTQIKAARVKKVFYTIDNFHYGVWFPYSNFDRIYEV